MESKEPKTIEESPDREQGGDLPKIEDLAKMGTELDGIDARLAELDKK